MLNPADAVCIFEASMVISKFAESKHRLLKSAKQSATSCISSIGVCTTIFDMDLPVPTHYHQKLIFLSDMLHQMFLMEHLRLHSQL